MCLGICVCCVLVVLCLSLVCVFCFLCCVVYCWGCVLCLRLCWLVLCLSLVRVLVLLGLFFRCGLLVLGCLLCGVSLSVCVCCFGSWSLLVCCVEYCWRIWSVLCVGVWRVSGCGRGGVFVFGFWLGFVFLLVAGVLFFVWCFWLGAGGGLFLLVVWVVFLCFGLLIALRFFGAILFVLVVAGLSGFLLALPCWLVLQLVFQVFVFDVRCVCMSGLSVRGVGGRVAADRSHMLWGGFSGSVCSTWVPGRAAVSVEVLSGCGLPVVPDGVAGNGQVAFVGVPVGWGSSSVVDADGGFAGFGVGGSYVEEFWGSDGVIVEPSSVVGAPVGGVPTSGDSGDGGEAFEGVGVLSLDGYPVGAGSSGSAVVFDTAGSGGLFGLVGGRGARFSSSIGFEGVPAVASESTAGVDGVLPGFGDWRPLGEVTLRDVGDEFSVGAAGGGWFDFLGSLGCSARGLFYGAAVGAVVSPIPSDWLVSTDLSEVGSVGSGAPAFGGSFASRGSGIVDESEVVVRFPMFSRYGSTAYSGVQNLIFGKGDIGWGIDGLPVALGVSEVGALEASWGMSSAALAVLGGAGFGRRLGWRLGVKGLGAAGLAPGVSGVAGSVDGFDIGIPNGGLIDASMGSYVEADGWRWRTLILGAAMVPSGFETLQFHDELTSGESDFIGSLVTSSASHDVLWGRSTMSGVYGGGLPFGGPLGWAQARKVRKVNNLADLGQYAVGLGGTLRMSGVSPAYSILDSLGRGVSWSLVESSLLSMRDAAAHKIWSGLVQVAHSKKEKGAVSPGLGLGFVAGSEGYGSKYGTVISGGASARVCGRAGVGVVGGWVDIPDLSPVLGLGITTQDVKSMIR